MKRYIIPSLSKYIKEQKTIDLDIKKMYGWYSSFKDRCYKDIQKAKDDIEHVVNHHNKQFSVIFGEDNPSDIINLFNFVETKNGVKIQPKLKQPITKKADILYNTDNELIKKQKTLWSDIRGIEFGRYLSSVIYINTFDKNIYGTEESDEQNILNIMKKLKDGVELPPILLDYDYGILDGHHRWEAAKRLKIKKIPVIIYEYPSMNENLDSRKNFSVEDYINQLSTNSYMDLTSKLFKYIKEEGWLEQLEEYYNKKLTKSNFNYTTLNLSDSDKNGLITYDDGTLEKFNDFDIKLKRTGKYPFTTLDFIDYEKGTVYIIKMV